MSREIPTDVSESFRKRNPHLYGPGKLNPNQAELKQAARIIGPKYAEVLNKEHAPRASKSVEERLNKTEKRWLFELRHRGFERVGIQDITLRLANDLRYTPDFSTYHGCGFVTLWEVKGGFIRDDARDKLKMAASLFKEFKFVRAQWKDDQWTETEIKP